jgi:hypothetical protein
MGRRGIAAAVLAAAVFAGAASFAAPNPGRLFADKRPGAVPVDVELVLAVDISYSMDPEEQALQRDGYVQALTSQEFLRALREGANGKIAVTYVEWAGAQEQRIIVPWRLVEGPESADALASEIARVPLRRAARTSVSGAILFSKELFADSGYRGLRRVIDVSGDGANNAGSPVTVARDGAIAEGITINGLPILLNRPNVGQMDLINLDEYYEDCVIGGPGSFVITIMEREKFKEAIRTKLVLEIAGRTPERPIVPVAGKEPRVNCMIGEKIWQDRWGR